MKAAPFSFVVAVTALFVAALTGCPATDQPTDDGGTAEPECTSRADCEGGLVCSSEAQRCTECDTPGQCLLRETCSVETRRCVFREGWGGECATNDQCQAGQWCSQGLCQDRSQVNLCPSGQNGECPAGDRCNTINTVCEEDLGCAENLDCSAAEICNTGLHACVPRCTVDTQNDVCGAGERCVNEMCVQCAADSDCGPGLVCDKAGRCSSGTRCYANADCKIPLICYVPTGACLTKPPPCVSDDNCPATQRCELGTGKCVPRACQPDPYEPNNDESTAFAAQGNKKYIGLTLCSGDVDVFALNLNRGDQLGVNLDADPFAENTFTTLIEDSSGRVLASGKLLVSFVASAQATYYVLVSSTDPNQSYDLNFLVSQGTPCDDDQWEPNDAASSATPLNTQSQIDGAICPNDLDHFRFTVPSGKGAKVSLMNYNSGAGLLQLCLYDASLTADGGTSLTLLGCSDDPTLPVVNAAAAQVAGKSLVARVNATDSRVQNTYTLKVEYP